MVEPASHGMRLAIVDLVLVLLALTLPPTVSAMNLTSTWAATTYHRVQVEGISIFYREAGPKDPPTLVLLHGYPSSSRMFNALIPLLATQYHLIAPDYPGSNGQRQWAV
jgi:hypothetical protein